MIDAINQLNQDLFLYIYNFSGKNELLDFLMIFGADYLILILFGTALLLLFRKNNKYKKAFLLTLVSLGLVIFLLKVFSMIIFEPRPYITHSVKPLVFWVPDNSFPSQHMTVITALAISYAFYKSRFALIILFAAVWIGFARIFVGVHYPIDILGGLLFGTIAASLGWKTKKILLKRFPKIRLIVKSKVRG